MGDTPPKVEFALGSEVSPGHFFKSSFARTIASSVSGVRLADTKSLDYEYYEANNPTIVEEPPDSPNNFYSLVNFDKETEQPNSSVWAGNAGTKRSNVEVTSSAVELSELEKLRKKCQTLTEENERLQSAAAATLSQPPHVQQVIDSVYLQQQVNTLQWQLKQSETSRQMYRSLMGEVVRFLDRARKSLDLIHERSSSSTKSHSKDKSRVPRSRSVHTVHVDSPGASSCASSTTSSTSSSSCSSSSSLSSSRFSRAKSVAQISSTANKDFTWSVLRRNDPAHCTPPRAKGTGHEVTAVSAQDVSKTTQDGVGLYRRPKQMELDPDDKPPEKLSQEAFRLMRTVQSLLVMREPDLARVSPNQDSPLLDHHHHHQSNTITSLHANFANSTTLQDSATTADALFNASSANSQNSSQTTLLMSPGARQSIDSTASSKTTEDENFNVGLPTAKQQENGQQQTQQANGFYHAVPLSSTPNSRRVRKTDRKELHLKSLRDWALGNSNGQVITSRPKPATSVSSAEDESGFSSMSSFQEVGLPQIIPVPNTLSPIKGGCHTEVGLPEVPIEKVRHRRWSSTPAEFHALLKRHSGSFANGTPNTTESLSVWV